MDAGESSSGSDTRARVHAPHGRSERVPRTSFPRRAWAFVRLHRTRVATGLLLLLGISLQYIAIAVIVQLVDLSLSLMEVWAELARKHLEVTLS